jgi:hypothetical protein
LKDTYRTSHEFENVMVCRSGKVYVVKEDGTEDERPVSKDDRGIYHISILIGKKVYKRDLARFVAATYIDHYRQNPTQYFITHHDGDRRNCALDNLNILKKNNYSETTLKMIDEIEARQHDKITKLRIVSNAHKKLNNP